MTEHEIEQQAIQWVVELETSRRRSRTWKRFEAWLAQDPRHREVFRRVQLARRIAGYWQEAPPTEQSDRRGAATVYPDIARRTVTPRLFAFFVAAALLGAFAFIGHQMVSPPARAWSYYATDYETKPVNLPDGASVTQDAGTRIGLRTRGDESEIHLLRGEILVVAPPVRTHSLTVMVGQTVIRVIGTEFTVRSIDPKHTETMVARGRVLLTANQKEATAQTTVERGNVAVVSSGQVTVQTLTSQQVNDRMAWLRGLVVFDGTLSAAVVEFNRYNPNRLVVADPALANVHVKARFQAKDLKGFTKLLLDVYGIQSRTVFNRDTGQDDILLGVAP